MADPVATTTAAAAACPLQHSKTATTVVVSSSSSSNVQEEVASMITGETSAPPVHNNNGQSSATTENDDIMQPATKKAKLAPNNNNEEEAKAVADTSVVIPQQQENQQQQAGGQQQQAGGQQQQLEQQAGGQQQQQLGQQQAGGQQAGGQQAGGQHQQLEQQQQQQQQLEQQQQQQMVYALDPNPWSQMAPYNTGMPVVAAFPPGAAAYVDPRMIAWTAAMYPYWYVTQQQALELAEQQEKQQQQQQQTQPEQPKITPSQQSQPRKPSRPRSKPVAKKPPTEPGLCASCDRCRIRKTRCDGNRPCGNCSANYMKIRGLTSLKDVAVSSEIECVYSRAKKRGPIPQSNKEERPKPVWRTCDRCRLHKFRCDGTRPCYNCISNYKEEHDLMSIQDIDVSAIHCIYSIPLRRGPIPGKVKDEHAKRLCASCDRCRLRKTRCDGKRPCSNCSTYYMKLHNLASLEGVNVAELGCVYSRAKKRGPTPKDANNNNNNIDNTPRPAPPPPIPRKEPPGDDNANNKLCASCDRCRTRKTKCDGNHPCDRCVASYKKAQKVESVEGIDVTEFECVYSIAKKRGPPGRGQQKQSDDISEQPNGNKSAAVDISNDRGDSSQQQPNETKKSGG